MKNILLLMVVVLAVVGCSSMQPEDFSSASPRFVPEQFFLGRSKGTGIFFDRFGDKQLSFTVELDGEWDGKRLKLTELLTYETGETVSRIYDIDKIDEHTYHATTADVVGTAIIRSFGNTLKWEYKLRQQIGDSTWTLAFDDWMFLQQDGLVLNRAFASKWGVGVGEVFMALQKQGS